MRHELFHDKKIPLEFLNIKCNKHQRFNICITMFEPPCLHM